MKAVGIIKMVDLGRTGTTKNGSNFEQWNIFFESGNDQHMVEIMLYERDSQTYQEQLDRRGLVVNAIGELEMKYTVDCYQGRWYRRCEFVGFRIPQQPKRDETQAATTTIAEPQAPGVGGMPEASAQQVAAGMAEAAAEVQIDPNTGLPF